MPSEYMLQTRQIYKPNLALYCWFSERHRCLTVIKSLKLQGQVQYVKEQFIFNIGMIGLVDGLHHYQN